MLNKVKALIRTSNRLTWELVSIYRLLSRKSLYRLLNMPHRSLLIKLVCQYNFVSVAEYGCSSGANLVSLKRSGFKGKLLYYDYSASAVVSASINLLGAKSIFPFYSHNDFISGVMKQSIHGPLLVVLDAVIMYLSPSKLHSLLRKLASIPGIYIYITFWDKSSDNISSSCSKLQKFNDNTFFHSFDHMSGLPANLEILELSGEIAACFSDQRWNSYGKFILLRSIIA